MTVGAVAQRNTEHVRDRGRHVECLHVGVIHSGPRLAGRLHEQRHRDHLLDVARVDAAARGHSHLPGEAVICGDHHERVVVDPGLLETPYQAAQQTVDEADLEQIALLVVAGEIGVPEAAQAVHARHEVACAAAGVRAGGQIQVRAVGEQHVLHPERGPRARPNGAEEAPEALRTPAVQAGDDRGTAPGGSAAHPGRAQGRGLLGGDHAVAVAGQRGEDRARVVAQLGTGARHRPHAVEDQRNGLGGGVVGGRGVAKPCGVARQRREVRVAAGIDLAVLVEQRVSRELVEHQQHDVRALALCAVGVRAGVVAGADLES